MSLVRLIAFRYLRARKSEGFISVIAGFSLVGIALGVATLIVVMAVMNGFRAELLGRIIGLNGHVSVYAGESPLIDYDRLADEVRKLPGVVTVLPLVEGQAMASANGAALGAQVRGMRAADIEAKPALASGVVEGTLEGFDEGGGIALGRRLADKLHVKVGGAVTLISPEGNQTVLGMTPRLKTYPVVALFDVGMYEYDMGTILLPLSTAQTFFRLPERVSALEITLDSPDHAVPIRRALQERFRDSFRFFDWQQSNASFFNAVKVERNVMFLILTLIIVVAAFNIISSMIMLVKDKTRDIAILRTMGASSGTVLRIFFLTGASIGVIGTVLGVGLGLGFALNIDEVRGFLEGLTHTELFSAEIYFLSHLPARVETPEVLGVVVMALLLTFLATILPAWRASRIDPAEALRYV